MHTVEAEILPPLVDEEPDAPMTPAAVKPANNAAPAKRKRRRARTTNPDKVGWRVAEWCDDVGVSKAFFYASIIKEVETVKLGAILIVLTPPRKVYLALKATQQAHAAE